MNVYYLKFNDDAAARIALIAAGLAVSTGKASATYAVNVDFIGAGRELDKTSGYTEVKSHPGSMVNVIAESLPQALEQYRVYPVSPMRLFAGWSPEEIAARATVTKPE